MKNITAIILLFVIGKLFSQNNCNDYKEDYIPKNLKDAIEVLNCEWPETDKIRFKNENEKEATIHLHFSTGLGIRNSWELWKGSRLSRFFNRHGIKHPDDMSRIILTSFHRYLNAKPINLKSQIKHYKSYWRNANKEWRKQIKKYKNLQVGDTLMIPMDGGLQSSDYTFLTNYSYASEKNSNFECIIEGTLVSKRKKRKKFNKRKYKEYSIELRINVLHGCDFKNPSYNEKLVVPGELIEFDMASDKVIIK